MDGKAPAVDVDGFLNETETYWDGKLKPNLASTVNNVTGAFELQFNIVENSTMGDISPGDEFALYFAMRGREDRFEYVRKVRFADEGELQLEEVTELISQLSDNGVDQATIDAFKTQLEAAASDLSVLDALLASVETSLGAGNVDPSTDSDPKKDGASAMTTFAAVVFAAISTLLF